jgi:hypothetical protein
VKSLGSSFADLTAAVQGLAAEHGVFFYWAVIAIVAAIVLAFVLLFSLMRRKTRSQARLLFTELCNMHQLSIRQRRLLRRLAGMQNMDDPTSLMVDATQWHLDELEKQSQLRKSEVDELRKLQSTLYSHSAVK